MAAHSEEEARQSVERYIADEKLGGWNTDDYDLTALEVGEVITNDNS